MKTNCLCLSPALDHDTHSRAELNIIVDGESGWVEAVKEPITG